MPQSSDCLQPPLTTAERAIVKPYGGWSQFLCSYGLKPWNTEEAAGGKRILESLASGSDYMGNQDNTLAKRVDCGGIGEDSLS